MCVCMCVLSTADVTSPEHDSQPWKPHDELPISDAHVASMLRRYQLEEGHSDLGAPDEDQWDEVATSH